MFMYLEHTSGMCQAFVRGIYGFVLANLVFVLTKLVRSYTAVIRRHEYTVNLLPCVDMDSNACKNLPRNCGRGNI